LRANFWSNINLCILPLSFLLYTSDSLSKVASPVPTMVQISEVKGNARENRTAAHTHIKGLGLRPDGTSESSADGFVGQATAREVGEMVYTRCE
jgi:hypothetical protein